MLRNYLLIAYRNFLKQKIYTFINIIGLAVGIASAICIFLYVTDELAYDSVHDDHQNIYGIGVRVTNKDGNSEHYAVAPGGWPDRLRQNLPEINAVTKVDFFGFPATLHNKNTDRIILTEEVRWVENNFAEVLHLPLIKGNKQRMLELPNALLVSESGAKRLFGNADPINQTITFKHTFIGNGREFELVVTGVYKDYPSNVHIRPDFFINILSIKPAFDEEPNGFDRYFNNIGFQGGFFQTYVRLSPNASLDNLTRELERLSIETEKSDSAFMAAGNKLSFVLRNVRDLHFDPVMDWEIGAKGNKTYLSIFTAIAIMILLIACINYMNLATARSVKRAKEVGMRKSLGGLRSELALQFIQESALLALVALFIAILVVVLVLPYFNTLANKTFALSDLLNFKMLTITIGIIVFITMIGGMYPAFVLSSFDPVTVLKGTITKGKGADFFRKALVSLQFIVSMVMVLGTVIIMRQMNLMQESKLNEQGDQILSIRFGGTAPNEKYEPFKQAVLQDNEITGVTIANHLPRLDFFGFIGVRYKFPEITDQVYEWNQLRGDYDFPTVYEMEFVSGRSFNYENVSDSSSIILNESAVAALNKTPSEALGMDGFDVGGDRLGKVIGVVKDFPYKSMHKKIEPLVITSRLHPRDRIVYVKLPKGKIPEKIKSLESTWKQVMPHVGFDYWFVKDEFNRMYKTERTVSSLAQSFTLLTLVITVLGLYGLASYTAEQRTKEVGIRKVMGATTSQVVIMFSMNFMKLFLIGTLVAVPVSYYIGDQWLSNFEYRVSLDILLFFFTILGLMLLTLITVSYETYRAAIANPVKAIRYE